ncbi:hypothetical protein AUJ17_05080 [Candidatus Micrarchaeota archaeon CG1_02_47_40]|nr:MAG: hypothetical protein AUJ17_05080 [Candidatus Micrarchaeota archaeon CG1_02_47_40]
MASVRIVGGGPAGLFTAIYCARAGHAATVLEEHKKIGLPVNCTGLVSKTGMDEIGRDVKIGRCIINEISGARIIAGKNELKIEAKETKAYVIDRAVFDSLCAKKAEEEGAKIMLGRRAGEGDLSAEKGAESIIGADGPNSFVARYFSFPPMRNFANTFQVEVEIETDTRLVQVHLSNRHFPGFFGWVVPLGNGYSRVGVGVGLPNNARKSFEGFAEMLGICNRRRHNISAAVIPLQMRKKTAMHIGKRNVFLVGDSAGQVKSTTGGGVVFGCLCAKILGRNIGNPQEYEREWRGKYGGDLKMHYAIRKALDGMNDAMLEKAVGVAGKMKLSPFLERYGHMDMPMKMTSAESVLNYLKLLVFG